METQTEKTFIPKSGDWIIADIRHQDGRLSGHVGEVVKRDSGYSTGKYDCDPIVFDEKGKIPYQVMHVEVFRNYKAVFLYDEDSKHESTMETETEKTFIPEPDDDYPGGISDGYHTFDELYYYRMLYNAMAANILYRDKMVPVFKSKKHHDGKSCFDGKYFIVQMLLPTGYVANHYELKYWDLFKVSEQEKAPFEYDGSTPAEEAERIHEYLQQSNRY